MSNTVGPLDAHSRHLLLLQNSAHLAVDLSPQTPDPLTFLLLRMLRRKTFASGWSIQLCTLRPSDDLCCATACTLVGPGTATLA